MIFPEKIFKNGALLVLSIVLFVSIIVFGVGSITVNAVDSPELSGDICSGTSLGNSPYCNEKTKGENTNPLLGQDSLPAKITKVITTLAGAISVIMVAFGGFRYAVSGGDQNAVKNAKNTILYALIGLVVAILAQVIVTFVLNRL